MTILIYEKCHYNNYIAFILLAPQYDSTALHDASTEGNIEVIELLLQFHADVNIKNNVSTESPH